MIITISFGNSERDLAHRNLLNRSIKIPEDLKKLLNIGKIKKKITNKENEIIKNNNEDIYKLLKLLEFHGSIYKRWSEKYKPQKVKLLFITEGITPNMENRLLYFYNPFNTQSNELFNYLMASIFPNYNKKCSPKLRANYLDRFIKKGYYLEDVFPLYDDSVNKESILKIWIHKELEKGLELLINKHTPIIIIKEELFNVLKSKLITLGYSNIYREAIPFPNINLHTFKEKIRNAIIDLNLV